MPLVCGPLLVFNTTDCLVPGTAVAVAGTAALVLQYEVMYKKCIPVHDTSLGHVPSCHNSSVFVVHHIPEAYCCCCGTAVLQQYTYRSTAVVVVVKGLSSVSSVWGVRAIIICTTNKQ